MSKTVEELSANFEQDGVLVVKELDRVVLTKGAWATVVFKYQDRDRKTGEYGAPKISLRRYRKMSGEYRQQNKFTISSMKQAAQLRDLLDDWLAQDA